MSCSTCSNERASGAIVFSPLAQGLLTDKYLDGVPDDSRLRRGTALLREHDHRREPRAGAGTERDRPATRADAGPDGDRLGPAGPAGHLRAARGEQRPRSSSRTSPRSSGSTSTPASSRRSTATRSTRDQHLGAVELSLSCRAPTSAPRRLQPLGTGASAGCVRDDLALSCRRRTARARSLIFTVKRALG